MTIEVNGDGVYIDVNAKVINDGLICNFFCRPDEEDASVINFHTIFRG